LVASYLCLVIPPAVMQQTKFGRAALVNEGQLALICEGVCWPHLSSSASLLWCGRGSRLQPQAGHKPLQILPGSQLIVVPYVHFRALVLYGHHILRLPHCHLPRPLHGLIQALCGCKGRGGKGRCGPRAGLPLSDANTAASHHSASILHLHPSRPVPLAPSTNSSNRGSDVLLTRRSS